MKNPFPPPFSFALHSAGQNFLRNKGLSFFAVSMMAVVLFVAGGGLIIAHSFNQFLETTKARATTISVFVADETPYAAIEEMSYRLTHDRRVRGVKYVSKAMALERYKKYAGTNKDATDALPGNPLPRSLDVQSVDIKYLPALEAEISHYPGLDKGKPTNYEQGVIKGLINVSQFVTLLGILVLVVLAALSVFVTMMSIRTAVFVRRSEIEIMKLVGATDWFVRGPFVMEGLLTGGLASAFAVALIAGGYRPFILKYQSSLPFIPLGYDGTFVWQLAALLFAVGLFLGATGSFLGVRRFLRT